MSQTLTIANFKQINVVERGRLADDAAIAATSLNVVDTNNFAADDYLYIGAFGSEGGELVTVTSTTDTDTLVVSALTKPHNKGEEIARLFGNQIRVYRAANVNGTPPSDGSYTLLETIDIDTDQASTTYTDSAGSSDYWYKYTYYNEDSGDETSLTDCTGVRSANNYTSVEAIRKKAGLEGNTYITDNDVNKKRQVAQDVINAKLTGLYTVPFTAPINPIIAEITELLAAGYLLTDDYGPLNKMDTKEGNEMLERANKYLEQLNNKELELTDVQGASTAITTNSGFQMWPNADTATTADAQGGGARMFRVSDRY